MRVISNVLVVLFVLVYHSNCEEHKENNPKPICEVCTCNTTNKFVDCKARNIQMQFDEQDWQALNTTKIDIIDMSSNKIVHLTKFPALDIKILDLSDNAIVRIDPQTFKFLQNLTDLNLSYNRLTSSAVTPDVFEGLYDADTYLPLMSIKILRLGNNMLHTLHKDLFEHMETLEVLSLDSNPLTMLKGSTEVALSALQKLQHLDLSYTELETIPEHILHGLRELKSLNLTGNLIKTLPMGLKYAINLTWLSLSENPLKAIEGDNLFPKMASLEVLHMCYMNDLRIIGQGGFSGLAKLKELQMTNNPHLGYIDPAAFSRPAEENGAEGEIWPPLEKLYLHNNNISTLDTHLLGRWDNMEIIDIRYNHWSCDCENQWLVAELIPLIVVKQPNFVHGLSCYEPPEMRGHTLFEMEQKHVEMRCADKYGNRPERDGAMLIGILVGLITAIPICLVAVLCYKRRCMIWGNRGPADFSRAFYQRADLTDNMQHM